ncbi:dienelactone hydrolase [Pseudomonas sp. UL073]|uniref:Dienelactone hydrolase n=1 Tax=Zestomonas insulae TaxID=2809017 RepID=A0ABS2IIK4_9GAMM|nr:dienelactone hydrolase [Pseudomonas insulae]MBM7061988.1 dienelactone hydrolase [Pseudomonas insulae]
MFARGWLLLICGLGFAGSLLAAPSVGFRQLQLVDPLDQRPLSAIAFYPSSSPEGRSRIGPYRLEAVQDTKAAKGRYPLLVLSHGNGGSPLAHHDLAIYLARQGFVVVAPWHLGDDDQGHSRRGTVSNLYGRPMQAAEAIKAVVDDRLLGPVLDDQHIGLIGYSAGGETALILAGAKPSPQRLQRYCAQHRDDQDACGAADGLRVDRDDLVPRADPRVGAVLLLAPAGLLFGPEELVGVRVPVLLYVGADDQLVPRKHNADALAQHLAQTVAYRLLDGAGHFVFMAPCSPEQAALMAEICQDAAGVDRTAVHRRLNAEAARFFREALGVDASALVEGQGDREQHAERR